MFVPEPLTDVEQGLLTWYKTQKIKELSDAVQWKRRGLLFKEVLVDAWDQKMKATSEEKVLTTVDRFMKMIYAWLTIATRKPEFSAHPERTPAFSFASAKLLELLEVIRATYASCDKKLATIPTNHTTLEYEPSTPAQKEMVDTCEPLVSNWIPKLAKKLRQKKIQAWLRLPALSKPLREFLGSFSAKQKKIHTFVAAPPAQLDDRPTAPSPPEKEGDHSLFSPSRARPSP